mmetsp:Transcript_17810/g.44437  ORF Transcript_17810/g.44437 Transcript_17810/m.44437 type:complete len:498 (-) Transcript_17810:69-1562(-)
MTPTNRESIFPHVEGAAFEARVRRRTWFRNRGSSDISSQDSPGYFQKGRISVADYQDGKRRHPGLESTSILKDTAEVFQNISTRLGFADVKPQQKNYQMDEVRWKVGLYQNFPLANGILRNSQKRETALMKSGDKQMNHVRGTDGWWLSMLVIEDRAMDNYLGPWITILLNAALACLLAKVWSVQLPEQSIAKWDTIYSMVLKTSLAFLLVFRLNRCAMRYWEARTMWGNMAHITRNLVSTLLLYGAHSPKHRDSAIKWGSSFCLAAKHFIRSDRDYNEDEFAGILTRNQVARLKNSNHSALFAASMCRYYLNKIFPVDETTPPGLAHAHTIRMQECDRYVADLVKQVSGMEKIRSTPLPIVYVTHLRTFLYIYLIFLPYSWVSEWGWSTIPLVGFTAFALLGIEGASSEVEIPFSKERTNHLAIDAYCLVILDSVLGLVVHDANMHMQGRKGNGVPLNFSANFDSDDDDDDDDDDEEEEEEEKEMKEEKLTEEECV